MTDKEKTDALIELEKIRIDKYKQTRDLEFKINLALWTMIILFGNIYRDKIVLDTLPEMLIYLAAILILVFGHYQFWLLPVSMSLARDNAEALKLQNDAEKIISAGTISPVRTINQIMEQYRKWNFLYAGISLFLMILVGILLSGRLT